MNYNRLKVRPGKRKFSVHWIFKNLESINTIEDSFNIIRFIIYTYSGKTGIFNTSKPTQSSYRNRPKLKLNFLALLNHGLNEAIYWVTVPSYPILMYNCKFSLLLRWRDLSFISILYLLCISFEFHVISQYHSISHTNKYKFGTAFVSLNCLDHCWRRSWQEQLSFHVQY